MFLLACPSGFVSILDNCYCTTADSSWTNAEATCRTMGAYLVTINSAAENSAIAAHYTQRLWIGMSRPGPYSQPVICSQALYSWVDGSTTTYNNWHLSDLDCGYWNGQYQGCGYINYPQPGSGVWDDDICSLSHPGLCKFQGV